MRIKLFFLFFLFLFFVSPILVLAVQSSSDLIRVVYQEMLDRFPSADELNSQLRARRTPEAVKKILNGVEERNTAIVRIYQSALKRNPRSDEITNLKKFVAPNNLIRKNLFESKERQLALSDLYNKLIGRAPRADELEFFVRTRSPFEKIREFLNARDERMTAIDSAFVAQLGRSPIAEERNYLLANRIYLEDIGDIFSAHSEFVFFLLSLVNDLRAIEGPPDAKPLALNDRLMKSAEKYGEYMLANNWFSHVSREGSHVDSRVLAENYNFSHLGENLGIIKSNGSSLKLSRELVQSLFNNWKASPDHYKNMVSADFLEVGIGFSSGLVSGDSETPWHLYSVLNFGAQF
ncbi:MAG: secreted trypsin-like serine protease [Parcubacteria group bacterium Gr01-1014_18]|nr:MAG: secreted trypsin-like serine protease [Parcubacteria group bacterium Greene0416_36]TSC81065.1 MAG: secreted trypsin-like serine protease [Parcubacteria group bacterium Gr01-1014_18]TSC98799.1 MAG: secreted trypsin-like serine protease [Parcubacteria group bacterium Greene1014_20]TSD06721.1 MAG: secreted trypsin-like serine protease [Parcubacteria group bacterium Greene0714_2]